MADTLERRLQDLKDPNSTYFRGVEAFLSRIAENAEGGCYDIGAPRKVSEERKVPYALRGEDLRKLSAEFGWKLVSNPREFSRTPYVAAKSYCSSTLNESIKSWAGEEVVYLEGDVTTVVARLQTWKHVCRAGASAAALHRYCAQAVTLRRMVSSKNSEVALMSVKVLGQDGLRNGAVMCADAKSCTRVCDTVLADLCHADISATQAAAVVKQHQAVRFKTWFYFDPVMMYQDEGPLSAFPGRFFVDRPGDRLYIIPEDSSAVDVIEYRWSNVLSFVQQPLVYYQRECYLLELHDSVPGVMFAILSDAKGECEFNVDTEHRLYHAAGEAMVEIEQKVTLPRTVDASKKPQSVIIRTPEALWEKVVARVMGIKEQKLTLPEARIAVADNSQQRVDTGTFVKVPRSMPFDVPEMLARAVWKKVSVERVRLCLESALAKKHIDTSWSTTMQKLVAVAMRIMHETSVTVDSCLLTLGQQMHLYDADLSEYDVHVQKVSVAEIMKYPGGGVDRGGLMSASYPGGPDVDMFSDTEASSRRASVRARALEVFDSIREFDVTNVSSSDGDVVQESVIVLDEVSKRELTGERELLASKMQHVYDVGEIRSIGRVEEQFPVVSEPVCSEEIGVGDPVSVLQADYVEDLPTLSGYRAEITPYVVGEADKSFDYEACQLVTNGARDKLPEPIRARKSKLVTACGGRRPVTQTEALLAFGKRVANAPNAALEVVYAERLAEDFKKFEDVFLRLAWRERVAEAARTGLWCLDVVEIRKHVAKLATTSVGVMIAEDFSQGKVDLTRWRAMVKAMPKPKMTESASSVYSAPQTIVYLASKMTNSWFSPMLSKFLDMLDQELEPWIRLNARRDRSDDERWVNSMQSRVEAMGEGEFVESDITQCDKSQQLYNMLFFFYVLEQFGAPVELMELWKVLLGLKRADAVDVGMAVWYVYQVVSGFWGTIAVNTLVVSVANAVCLDLDRGEVVTFEARGDDALVRRLRNTDVQRATERFTDKFNFEAKVYVDLPPYFCSDYDVVVQGYHFRVRDPWKVREALGRYVGAAVSLEELYESYSDTMKHYEKKEVMDALDVAVQRRLGCGSVRSTLRALSALKQDKQLFVELFDSEVSVIGW